MNRNQRSQTRMWSSSGHKNQASGGSGGVAVGEGQRASECPYTAGGGWESCANPGSTARCAAVVGVQSTGDGGLHF